MDLHKSLITDNFRITYTKRGSKRKEGAEFLIEGSILTDQERGKALYFIARALSRPSLLKDLFILSPIQAKTYFSRFQVDDFLKVD